MQTIASGGRSGWSARMPAATPSATSDSGRSRDGGNLWWQIRHSMFAMLAVIASVAPAFDLDQCR